MLSTAGIRPKVSLVRSLISDQTLANLHKLLNSAGLVFDVAEGLGTGAAATSSIVLVGAGGFANQQITADLKWIAPSDVASHDIGVIARVSTVHADTECDYLYARVDGGVAKISKVIGGAFTTLTSNAFVVPIDTVVTVRLSCVGTTITAVFTCAGVPGSPLTLSTTNADVPQGGLMGMRSLTSTVWMRSFTAEEL